MEVEKLLFRKPKHFMKYLGNKVAFDGRRLVAIVGFGDDKKPCWYCGNEKYSEDWRKAKHFNTFDECMDMRAKLKKEKHITFINPVTPLISYYDFLVTVFNFSSIGVKEVERKK